MADAPLPLGASDPDGGDISDSWAYDMTYAGTLSFGRRRYSRDLGSFDLAVVGIPFDLATTNRPGARLGPRAIREQSSLSAEFPSGLWPWDHSVFTAHRVVDYGDIGFAPGYPDDMLAAVEREVGTILDSGAQVVSLGGDHLVALPLLRAHAARFGPLSLIHLDAHSDTWEDPHRNHGTMFLEAARDGLIDPARSIQIGMRTPNETHGFNVIWADEFLEQGVGPTVARIHEIVGDRPAYLTVDIDFLDPAYAPGTGTPVVGGATTWQARQLLFGMRGLDIVGADQVEVSPIYDGPGQITALAGATLAHDELYLVGEARARRAARA